MTQATSTTSKTRRADASIANPDSDQNALPQVHDIGWKDAPRVIGSGFAMGSADVVPGVSGGTMAVACGIYQELLAAIASADMVTLKALLKFRLRDALGTLHYKFLCSLFVGIFAAVVVMVVVVNLPGLLISNPTEVYAVFFGLVLASVFVLGKKVSWGALPVLSLLFGTGFGWLVVNLVPVDTPISAPFMFGYGAVAISAMLLPGISGSFILLILGQYEHVIGSIKAVLHGDLAGLGVLVPFALGCLFGLIAFSRLVAWTLRRFHEPTMAALSGLLLGSLWRIWPFQHTVTQEVHGKLKVVEATPVWPEAWSLAPLLLVLVGFGAVFAVEYLASARRRSGG